MGAIRDWLELLKNIAQQSGLTLEQVADVFDASQRVQGIPSPASSTGGSTPLPPTSGTVQ